MFQFESLQAFLSMEGHGEYVWSSYLISLTVMIWLVIRPTVRKRQLLAAIQRQKKREASLQQQDRRQ